MSSTNAPGAFHEAYDVYDPSSFTTASRLRQQQAASRSPALAPPDPLLRRPSSVSESSQTLRRSPRSSDFQQLQQEQLQRLSHRRALSVDGSGHHQYIEQSIPVSVFPAPHPTSNRVAPQQPAPPSDAHANATEEDSSTVDDSLQRLNDSNWQRRSTRVSPTTASAILWTLEEAFRKPLPFTTDWEEANAPMSDFVGGVAGTTPLGGNGHIPHGPPRAGPGPVPINTQHPSGGVRTPTDIMRQRREREGRRKAEQEARDREQEEAERRRQLQAQEQPGQVQQPFVAGGDRMSQRRPTTSAGHQRQRTGSLTGQQPGPPPSSAQPFPGSQQSHGQAQFPGSAAKQPNAPQSQQQSPRRVAFPHAFERWETLSSHWEGLTGYWIRKLEQNNQDLERDPLSQQMARQVTDLSAAGANLFHAVVELQRLRASSERKFQRWFFETRAEQERAKELQGEMERQVRAERQARTEAVSSLQKADGDKRRAEDLLREMRRELQISKDEARRAWEELGRREQEERDRTASLRSGEPTLVGGVQVVPMIAGLPNRQNPVSQPSTQETAPYPVGEGMGKMPDPAEGQYYEDPASPTGSDPFAEDVRADNGTGASQRTYPGHFYHPESSVVRHGRSTSDPDDSSFIGSSEPGEEEYSSYRPDPQGRPIVYPGTMSEESEEFDAPVSDSGQYVTEGGYIPATTTTATTSAAPVYTSYPATSAGGGGGSDVVGSGYGWDAMTPRHRHPTRLSDVIEEEEPRTTPSRASRTSRAS